MTREEARQEMNKVVKSSLTDNEKRRAINSIFEKREQQEPCEDCISRKAVLDMSDFVGEMPTYSHPYDNLKEVVYVEDIESLPPVTPTRKVGKWIGHREHCESLGVMPSGLGAYEWCSNCDCGIDVREWQRNNYNFCPNCGADMER